MNENSSKVIQYRVDSSVMALFLLVGIIGMGILGFKFYSYTPEPDVDFVVLGDDYKVKEMIKFENHTYGKHEFIWDFGDSSRISILRSPVHVYEKSGEYKVSLLVDNQFKKEMKIVVDKAYKPTPTIVIPTIAGPSSVTEGKTFILTCPTSNVKSYAWYVDGDGTPVGYHRQLKWKFDKAGIKRIMLIVNGERRYTTSKSLNVRPALHGGVREENTVDVDPIEPYIPDQPNVYVEIDSTTNHIDKKAWLLPESDQELETEFVNVVSGKRAKKEFVKYLNGGTDYQLIFANEKYVTFDQLLEDMQGNDYVIKSFSTLRNNNRITKLTIKYRIKRRIF